MESAASLRRNMVFLHVLSDVAAMLLEFMGS